MRISANESDRGGFGLTSAWNVRCLCCLLLLFVLQDVNNFVLCTPEIMATTAYVYATPVFLLWCHFERVGTFKSDQVLQLPVIHRNKQAEAKSQTIQCHQQVLAQVAAVHRRTMVNYNNSLHFRFQCEISVRRKQLYALSVDESRL